MSTNRHALFEELISASLTDDLTDAERAQLDAHLDGCAACRGTLASFSEQRRIMAGLRHVAPPRDLGARVRAGVERGAFAHVRWWRRPTVVFAGIGGGLAAVAGVLLAIVLLNGGPADQNVGVGSAPASPSFASASMAASPVPVTPSPTATMSSPAAPPTATPVPEALPQPDVYLAYTGPFDNLLLTLRDGRTGQTLRELDTPGPPIAAELSPNGQFLAYVAEQGQSGTNELWVIHVGSALGAAQDDLGRIETPLAEWDSMELGRSLAGSEFLEHVAWSPSSQYLAFTIAATDGTGSDAWLFDAGSAAVRQLTTTGTGFAASWVADSESWAGERSRPQLLWVSLAGTQPTSQLIDIANPDTSLATTGTFQPLLSPDGARVIYWRGVMAASEDDGAWSFLEGGAPYLADVRASEDTVEFVNERPLFSDVTIDRDAFAAAGIVWGADSDAYAVWDAEWAGIPQGRAGEYPSVRRVYFGHASDERNLTEVHAIDEADLDLDATVVDIKVPTGRHLLITARLPIDGTLSVPRAQLILVTRNTGQVADEIERFTGPGEDAWFGPAANDARGEIPIEP